MFLKPLIAIQCRLCSCWFFFCLSCYHGQAYCKEKCRRKARWNQLKKSRQKYESSEEAKKKHADRQKRYRQRKKNELDEKSVTDQGTQGRSSLLKEEEEERVKKTDNYKQEEMKEESCDQAKYEHLSEQKQLPRCIVCKAIGVVKGFVFANEEFPSFRKIFSRNEGFDEKTTYR